ncbi:ADP-ribosylation [Schizopora paradoxa]|uniref:ADP-ribosylation n=1 Tax=Schizopora paradoxa TaxID=27342 RepID=A0A0H2R1G3_9AGAM|nr:ADP-ribosylation [Schizopora paradoxa]
MDSSPNQRPSRRKGNGIALKSPSAQVDGLGKIRGCALRNCYRPAYVDALGVQGKYCSLLHKQAGQERCCLLCRRAPIEIGHFCSKTCALQARDQAPCLLVVPTTHNTFKDVRRQFKKSWRHTQKKCPHLRAVYKIVSSKKLNDDYEAYRTHIESQRNFVATGNSPGNERRRWHGTARECSLGDTGNVKPCFSQTCSLCGIIRSSFDVAFFGRKTGWGRFGRGIYTSSTSSKSDDYSQNNGQVQSQWKALLLNKVVVGRGHRLTQGDTTLTNPPIGFDSIIAEPGDSLNYDELVVYSNNAIKPSYLVMYE